MTFKEFDQIIYNFEKQIQAISASKGREYANGEDRLGNFKRISEELDELSPMKVAWVFIAKHLDSIKFAINNPSIETSEKFESRCLDVIVYMMLLYALYIEEQEKVLYALYIEKQEKV